MTTLYNSIKIGDTITMSNYSNLVKSGVISSIRKWNGSAMQVTCTNGAVFQLNRYVSDFSLSSEVI
jgi:hypothetical protein